LLGGLVSSGPARPGTTTYLDGEKGRKGDFCRAWEKGNPGFFYLKAGKGGRGYYLTLEGNGRLKLHQLREIGGTVRYLFKICTTSEGKSLTSRGGCWEKS